MSSTLECANLVRHDGNKYSGVGVYVDDGATG